MAVAKTGKLHGVLGQELEEARLLYLEKHENVSEEGTPSHENTHTHEEQKEKKPRGKHSKKDVMYGHSQTTKRFGMRANRRIMNKFELAFELPDKKSHLVLLSKRNNIVIEGDEMQKRAKISVPQELDGFTLNFNQVTMSKSQLIIKN